MLSLILWNLVLTLGFAIILSVACRMAFLRRRPAIRHALWLLLIAKLVVPPVIPLPFLPAQPAAPPTERSVAGTFPIDSADPVPPVVSPPAPKSLPEQARPTTTPTTVAANPEPTADKPEPAVISAREPAGSTDTTTPAATFPFLAVGIVISLAGTALGILLHVFRAARFSRWLGRAGKQDGTLAAHSRELAELLGIRRPIRSCVVDTCTAPLLWGMRSPIVVLPRELLDSLNTDQLRNIVAHELAHYRRRDQWSNLFAFTVKMLLWWNPVAWWAHRQLRDAQELCCDALAIQLGSRHNYATTLLRALDFVQSQPYRRREFALEMGARGSILRRFEMIADAQLSHRLPVWTLPFLLLTTFLLISIPVNAQERAKGIQSGTAKNATFKDPLSAVPAVKNGEGKSHVLSGQQSAIALSAIVTADSPDKSAQYSAWISDRMKDKVVTVQKNAKIQVGPTKAVVTRVQKDSVTVLIRGKHYQWRLGTTLKSTLASQPAASPPSKPAAKPKTSPFDVQIELRGKPAVMTVRGKDVKRLFEMFNQLTKDDSGKSAPTLRTYSLGKNDPQLVLNVMQTLLKGHEGTRLAVDKNTRRLIALASDDGHKAISGVLSALNRQPSSDQATVIKTLQGGKQASIQKTLPRKGSADDSAKLKFSFKSTPWNDVLKWYADLTNVTLEFTEMIPGTLSFHDSRSYTTTESLDLFNSLLVQRGFVLIRRQNLLHVVSTDKTIPAELVPRVSLNDLAKRAKLEFVSVTLPLDGKNAEEHLSNVKPLLSANGRVALIRKSDQALLHLTDRAEIVRSIASLLADKPTSRGR